jgi:hypothetical protein
VRAVALALTALALVPGCESCEFTYGSVGVAGTLVIKGPVPADLRIELCDGPGREDCGEYPEGDLGAGADGRYAYTAYIPAEGVWTCGFNRRWIVVTGTNCTTTAVEALSTDSVDPPPGDVDLDLELHCAVSI